MLALDTDSLAADVGPEAAVFAAGQALGYRAFTLGARRSGWEAEAVVPALRKRKLAVAAVHGPEVELPGNTRVAAASLLGVEDFDRRAPAIAGLERAVSLSARLSARALVLDLGTLPLIAEALGVDEVRRREASRDRALDRVLPALFELTRACPEVPLAVSVPEQAAGWPDPETLEILLAELRGRRLGWWFDSARAHCYAQATGVPPEVWLDRCAADLLGVALTDVGGDQRGLPLGAGEVDFRVLQGLGGDTVLSVRVDPAYGPDALREAPSFLRGLGIG